MSKDEFIEFHGEEAWKELVCHMKSMSRAGFIPWELRGNENALVHNDIIYCRVLPGIGISGQSLIELKRSRGEDAYKEAIKKARQAMREKKWAA